MTVVRAVAEAARCLGLPSRSVLVASSGGLDSTVLLHALHELREELCLNLLVGHVNHALRGSESEADEAWVRALATGLGVSFHTARVDVAAERVGRPSRERPTLQEAARTARYRALAALAREAGASAVATAHHAGDQAETVLLRLFRGTGPDGLGGIPPRSADGSLVRPLLGVSRREIEAFARARGLSWREDTSNASTAYARNRLRRDWIPGLARDFNPRLLRAISDLAEAQRRDAEWIASQVKREADLRFREEGAWLRIEAKDWDALPDALARRLAREALSRVGRGRHASRVHLARMLAFLTRARPGTRLELPGRLRLERDAAGYRIGPVRGAC